MQEILEEYKKRDDSSNGIKLSGQMPKTSLILKSERSFYFLIKLLTIDENRAARNEYSFISSPF